MRVSPLLLLICVIFYNCSSNKSALTDLDKIGLKGPVKYLKFKSQLAQEDGELVVTQNQGEGIRIDNEFFFNADGMISEQRQYSSTKLSQIFVYKYDNYNRLISKDYFNSSHELAMKSKFQNVFNDNGKITKQLEFRAIGSRLVDTTRVSYQKSPYEIMEFSYNGKGNLIKLTRIQSIFGSSFPKDVIEYKNGKLDKQLTVDSDGNVIHSSKVECLKFDKNGNCLKLKTTDNDQTEEYTNVKIEYYK